MSKLAHSHQPTMDAIDYRRAMENGAVRPMSEAPTDGSHITAVMSDDQAPNCEKVRFIEVYFNSEAYYWTRERRWVDADSEGESIDEADLEGWLEP